MAAPTRTFRPVGARVVAYVVAVLVVVLSAFIGVALPDFVEWHVSEVVTMALLLVGVLAGLHAIGRSKVVVDDEALHVTNGFRTRHVPWSDVAGFAMNSGAPWPTLVTKDDERVMLFAIQGSDGAAAAESVAWLRSRVR
ncbi:PH domain-containing protein [Aeromicrobium massiliense]|uniref:PH domain-containing protein n=1 Tax=Aeromicrobium massiliense TaxID=1464554 RepID=UPI0002F06C11|nr:PH domain-containing protein [Aeromicrobium massiliense]